MNPIPKQDLRFVKNENLIRKTFREMMAETEYSKISIKELTERAQINRKTFYLHYVFPDDVEKIIQHSFQFMAALDPVDKKILSSKGNIPDEKSPSDLIREHFFIKYDRFPEYNRFESNLIITYFSVCLGVIYRQWEVDGQCIPLEKMVPLATRLILHGLDGAGLTKKDAGGKDTSPETEDH